MSHGDTSRSGIFCTGDDDDHDAEPRERKHDADRQREADDGEQRHRIFLVVAEEPPLERPSREPERTDARAQQKPHDIAERTRPSVIGAQ